MSVLKKLLDLLWPCRSGHNYVGRTRLDHVSPDASCGMIGYVYTIRCDRCGKRKQ